ncbi:RING-H2 finger protein ATL66-like [Actinidia eriantha]|uniref:RING-H2 finger protein ATL66-like n=1 Tax=Actinidia eriantha TaxID=165200 RepID=UPI00258BA783|nr:RING-H2 finger protein ATL66-like [Actinidia eriantha]
MMSSGINLVMTVIGFAVSTMFIVFVCTRLICARIQLISSRRSFAISSRSDLSMLERGLHGLEPLVIAKFPKQKCNDAFFGSSEDAQCTICLAEYHGEDILRILPYCGHSFHATCIDKWLQQHSTCPVCRISLRELPDKNCMQPMFSSAVRFQYGTESLDTTNSCHCLPISSGLSSGPHDDPTVGPVLENQFALESNRVEDGESVDGSQATKDLQTKHVESPSNT